MEKAGQKLKEFARGRVYRLRGGPKMKPQREKKRKALTREAWPCGSA